MEVKLHASLAQQPLARQAADAVEACVHCGFCLATCPTYLDNRDERDSPRGRIYLVREFLESGEASALTRRHLDRCLGCRACESTCPSGVRYAEIAEAGAALTETRTSRPPASRVLRQLLSAIVPYPRRFAPLLALGRALRPVLPRFLRQQLPRRQRALPPASSAAGERRVLLLDGCVQACATPRSNQAARLILARLGISVIAAPEQGCCGALDSHLNFRERGRKAMRRNIDAWWPAIEQGAEAVLSTATGCGAQLAHYGAALADDPTYAAKARRVSELAQDLSTFIEPAALRRAQRSRVRTRVAVHTPCSQVHALRHPDSVRELLATCGYELTATRDEHLCCGSAGTYSLLEPSLSARLRDRKRRALRIGEPELIATANVGCQLHLDGAVPVVHWAELVWEALN